MEACGELNGRKQDVVLVTADAPTPPADAVWPLRRRRRPP